MEILAKLGINGKIFLAQIVNFFLLLYVLKRFLYQPLLNVMKERERKIKQGIVSATKAEKRLEEIEENAKKQLGDAAVEADKILEKAHVEAEEHRKDLLRETQEEILHMKEETKELLRKEKDKIIMEVRQEAADMIVQTVKKIVGEKITAEDKKKFFGEVKEEMEKII